MIDQILCIGNLALQASLKSTIITQSYPPMRKRQWIPRQVIGTNGIMGQWWAGILFTHATNPHDCKINPAQVTNGRIGWRALGTNHRTAVKNLQKTAPRQCIDELLEAPNIKLQAE